MTPKEIVWMVDGFYQRFGIIDTMFALSTRMQMGPHAGKKTPELSKLRVLPDQSKKKPSKSGEVNQPEAEVISLSDRKQARDAIAASRNRFPWSSGR